MLILAFLACNNEIFGNPNAQASEAVKGLGAQVYGYYDGFTR